MVRVSIFSGFDRLLGFAFGVLRAFVILGLLGLLAARLQLDREAWWKASNLVPYVEMAGQIVGGLVGEASKQVGTAIPAAEPR